MICFDQVVLVLLGDVAGGGQQLVEHTRVGGCSVGGHFGWRWAVLQRLGEEPAGRRYISFRGHQHVDDLAELVNRPIQIDPSPRDFDIRFIDKPPVTRGRVGRVVPRRSAAG
jgi:hypothetical protein